MILDVSDAVRELLASWITPQVDAALFSSPNQFRGIIYIEDVSAARVPAKGWPRANILACHRYARITYPSARYIYVSMSMPAPAWRQVDVVLRRYEGQLRLLFKQACALKPWTVEHNGLMNNLVTYRNWTDFMRIFDLVNLDCSERDATLCFAFSKARA